MRLRSPLGPFGDEPSASWQRRRSCPLQTRTPDESLRILPPWLSIPTDFPLRAIARTRVSICSQGWAKTNRRSGPIQNTEINHEAALPQDNNVHAAEYYVMPSLLGAPSLAGDV